MSVPVHCSHCGHSFISQTIKITNSTNISFVDCWEPCTNCGRLAAIQSATYDFVGDVLTAVKAPGVMREDLIAFQAIATAVKDGELSAEQAVEQAKGIAASFGTILEALGAYGVTIDTLLLILTLMVTIHIATSTDDGAAQAHKDALRSTAFEQMIYEKVAEQRSPAPSPEAKSRPKSTMPLGHQGQTPRAATPVSRHERRKAASLARREPKPRS